jgi:BMFP domain-containing protein YqiC
MHHFGELQDSSKLRIIGKHFRLFHLKAFMNNSDFFQKFQTMAEDVQKKVLETVRQSPAKDIEQNIRGLMHQGFQKLDLVTRQEFDIQMQVLGKTRSKLEELERKVTELETRVLK